MDNTFPKRRKVGGYSSEMNTSKGKGKAVQAMPREIVWVPNKVPIEIFNLIIAYLPRSSIESMRLVNHEFERNVSHQLFKYVVVPFRPEIYGITSEPSTSQSSILLQDKGMRIFQGFGRHIKHFAMSFEVDLTKLTNPPVKSEHDTITTFWGSYKWPYQNYNRYAQLEGLEQKADETRTMTKAFQYIETAEELGLSIDGGLGWLAGPDVNQKVVQRGEQAVVFGSSRFIPEPKQQQISQASPRARHPLRREFPAAARSLIQRMLREVGYRNDLVDNSLDFPQADEGQAENTAPRPRGRLALNLPYTDFEAGIARMIGDHFGNGTQDQDENVDGTALNDDDDDDDDDRISFEGDNIGGTRGERINSLRAVRRPNGEWQTTASTDDTDDDDIVDHQGGSKHKRSPYPLKPNELTVAQKEMLLELEWAQRAFMQTFTIAVIDSPVTFIGVKKLTIARLPNRHLPNLVREDFWNSLPNLNLLSLAVIPDWRELLKLPTSWVQDNRLVPSKAVTGVFQLLTKQISQRQNIKSLHFEWIGGGEYAPGIFCRNQHVLAAPVVSEAIGMVNRFQEKEILSLPYIQDLSLKNCWFSPHIFTRFISELKRCNLQHLTLDSVSLTAHIRPGSHPTPHVQNGLHQQNAMAQAMAAQVGAANMGVANQLLAPPVWNPPALPGFVGAPAPALFPPILAPAPLVNNPNAQPAWLDEPPSGSWADVIETLTPGNRLADLRHASAGEFSEKPEPTEQSGFKKLVFRSCGYVRLHLDFDQSVFNDGFQPPRGSTPSGVTKRIDAFESVMMKPGDTLLGCITNSMKNLEISTLENAWNMDFGWNLPNSQQMVAEAKHDGILRPGFGRFNGSVEAPAPAPEVGVEVEIDMSDL